MVDVVAEYIARALVTADNVVSHKSRMEVFLEEINDHKNGIV